MHKKRIFMTGIVSLAILGAGVGIAVLLKAAGPEAPKKPPETIVTGVVVFIAANADVPVTLTSQGTVAANRTTVLSSEVGGKIVEVAPEFEAGGLFEKDALMLRIEDADYKAAVAAAEAAVAGAKEQLALESARADQGRRDWQRLGRGGEPDDLVLRVPQLQRARANLASAEAALEQARRNLERTRIRAPYDCRVRADNADLGAVVGPGAVLGQITSRNDFEVRLPLSLEEYGFLKTDARGRPSGAVTLRAQVGGKPVEWRSHIVRSENEVERRTLSIHVVAAVEPNKNAPPGFTLPPLGLFVHARIEGRTLHNVVPLPRKALRSYKRGNEDNRVYVAEDDNTLGFRDIHIRFADSKAAYIDKGLNPGDRVVLTKVAAPVVGKPLKVLSSKSQVPNVPAGQPEQE